MLGTWPIAARNLLRNRKRNLATGSAIAIGFAAMLALSGFINRVEKYLQAYTLYAIKTGHITIFAAKGLENYTTKPKAFSLNQAVQKDIQDVVAAIPNVQIYGGQLFGAGLIGNGCRSVPFYGNGINPATEKLLREHPQLKQWANNRSQLIKGKHLSEFPDDLGGILMANGLARILNKPKTYDELPAGLTSTLIADCSDPKSPATIAIDSNVQLATSSWSGTMTALDAEIVGHYDPGVTELANTGILTTLNFMQRLLDTDHVTHYSIWLRNPNLLAENSRTISERLKAKGHNLDIYPWNDKQLSPMYTGTIQFLETLINFLASVLGVVIVFSIFNSATMTVIERAPEIGMMRSMGYKKSHIRQLFIQEAVVLTLLSLIAGGILGAVFIFGVNQGDIYLYPPGISGGLRLELKPDLITCLVAGLLIFVLATLATGFATRNVIKKGISNLLMGSNR